MPRTYSEPPSFTEADLAPSFPTYSQKPTRARPPVEDILVALEAITSSPTYSAASTTDSASSLNELSLIPQDQQQELVAVQLFQDAGNAAAQLSWAPSPPSQQIPSADHNQYQLLPASDPSQRHLWSDLSPVSIVPPIPSWGSQSPVQNVPLGPANKLIRKSKARKASPPTPSRFCHICARTQKSTKVYCANLNTDAKCRKAVCQPCFEELRWDFAAARDSGTWLCPHCRGICPSVPRARCHIYTKTNEKRKVDRSMKR